MKRLLFLLSSLTFLFSTNLFAALPTGAFPCKVNLPYLYGGCIFSITGLHWSSDTEQEDYALTFKNFDPVDPRFFDDGRFHDAFTDTRWGYIIKLGYLYPCSSKEIEINYTNYEHGRRDKINQSSLHKVILPTLSDRWPAFATVTITNPRLLNSPIILNIPGDNRVITHSVPKPTEPTFAAGKTHVKNAVIDVSYDQFVNLGQRTRMKVYGGLRFAEVKNDLEVTYRFTAPSSDVTLPGVATPTNIKVELDADFLENVNQKTHYSGGGPRIGLDFRYHMRWGFGLVSEISTSALFGNIQTNLDDIFTRTATATVVSSSIPTILVGTAFTNTEVDQDHVTLKNKSRIVPNIDAKIGLDYTTQYCNCNFTKLTFEVGYMISYYFNAVQRVSEVGIQNVLNTSETMDVHFRGVYLGAQIKI